MLTPEPTPKLPYEAPRVIYAGKLETLAGSPFDLPDGDPLNLDGQS